MVNFSLKYWFTASSTPTLYPLGYVLKKPNVQIICLQRKHFRVEDPNPVVEGNLSRPKLHSF